MSNTLKPQSTFTTALSMRFMVMVCDFMSCCDISDLLACFSCHPEWGQLLWIMTDIMGTSSWGTRYTNSVYLKHISLLISIAIVTFAIILLFVMILSFAAGIIFATKLITLDWQSAAFFCTHGSFGYSSGGVILPVLLVIKCMSFIWMA